MDVVVAPIFICIFISIFCFVFVCNLAHNWNGIVEGGQYHSTHNTNHAAGWRLLHIDSYLTHELVCAVVDCAYSDLCLNGHKLKGAKGLRTNNINYLLT